MWTTVISDLVDALGGLKLEKMEDVIYKYGLERFWAL